MRSGRWSDRCDNLSSEVIKETHNNDLKKDETWVNKISQDKTSSLER
jgi:hypothetical protein